jgi:glycosyltransferase involved in cell wall biosynthesis
MNDLLQSSGARLQIDWTHMGRRATGLERITRELFSPEVLRPLPAECVKAGNGRARVMAAQLVGLPIHALRRASDVFVFPGFPPSPFFPIAARTRTVLYVHDVFLLTRRGDLNAAAKYYMAPLFSLAVKSLRYFLVNSEHTGTNLRQFCKDDAKVIPYRPAIRNVFELSVGDRLERSAEKRSVLRFVAIGTIEPRKNLKAAAQICAALASRIGCRVELHLIGRTGWGTDAEWLTQQPHVTLHGALEDAQVRTIIETADFLICTSHAEGLGLPLLEVQHAGLAVIAPDQPVFREVLGRSGILVDPADAMSAAERIAGALGHADWRASHGRDALANVRRWNDVATRDRSNVIALLQELLAKHRPAAE